MTIPGRDDVLGGGARRIPVSTPAGMHRAWVKRIGNNPALRVLLLHGGPGATHEYLEACDSFLPAAGVEYYYYDQLGSGFSDQPAEPSLWELDRFVDEVEQVRGALGLDRENFVLYGHSWGGILAIEYALRYQRHLRGLVISNGSPASCTTWQPRSRHTATGEAAPGPAGTAPAGDGVPCMRVPGGSAGEAEGGVRLLCPFGPGLPRPMGPQPSRATLRPVSSSYPARPRHAPYRRLGADDSRP